MPKAGWNTLGALLISAAFMLCLMSPNFSISLRSGTVSFVGSTQGMLLPLFGIAIAWFGVRDGQRWAWWTVLLGLLTVAILRIAVDRSCSVRIFWQHGCHQFMLGLLLGAIGLVVARD